MQFVRSARIASSKVHVNFPFSILIVFTRGELEIT
jgi:hypothetical protein